MKVIRNIIIIVVVLLLIIAAVGVLMFSPNYRKDSNYGKTNLIINYTNVTSSLKGKVFTENNEVYLSVADIENFYDRYIYYDEQYNYVIITRDASTVCFDISNGTMDINGTKTNVKSIKEESTVYVPITRLEDVYNIKVTVKDASKNIIIDSLDRALETATVSKKTKLKYKRTTFSRNVEKINAGDKVAIVPTTNKNAKYTYVRTSNGNLGYVKSSLLSESVIERKETKVEEEEHKPISMVWETFEYSAPVVNSSTKYDGVNVVCPTFLYMDGDIVKDKIDSNGVNYINWAKQNKYEVWALINNNNISSEKMDEFSSWINDYEKRKKVINQIIEYVKKYEFEGVNIDFENVYLKDKEGLTRFFIELKPALESVDAKLTVDVTEPDGSENWSLCYNRNVIGDVSDYIVFMAYDQHGRNSSVAGPTAACYWVERNIKKFLNQEEVPAEKIILGVPFYTVLWKEKDGTITGTSIPQKNIKVPSGVETTWLEDSKQYYMEYNQNGYLCKMWIEDTEATSQKLDFIDQYGLAGAAFWAKGYENPEVWSIVKEKVLNK